MGYPATTKQIKNRKQKRLFVCLSSILHSLSRFRCNLSRNMWLRRALCFFIIKKTDDILVLRMHFLWLVTIVAVAVENVSGMFVVDDVVVDAGSVVAVEGTESVTTRRRRGVAASDVGAVALLGGGPRPPWPYYPAHPSCFQYSPPLVFLWREGRTKKKCVGCVLVIVHTSPFIPTPTYVEEEKEKTEFGVMME